jgi:cation diffusion facilitator family transporter
MPFFCVGKFLIGLSARSVSIMADAINSLSDTVSSFLTLIGFRIAAKPADREHPYGHERFEYISGFVVSLLITFVGFQFLKNAFEKIITPEPIRLSSWVVYCTGLVHRDQTLARKHVSSAGQGN